MRGTARRSSRTDRSRGTGSWDDRPSSGRSRRHASATRPCHIGRRDNSAPGATPASMGLGIPLIAAAAIALVVYIIPGVDRRTTVSAAEILDRSRSALAAQTSGIEVLTYDLELAGVLAELVP